MLSSIDRMRHSQIWDLLNKYADIREHLEDIFFSMQMLQSQMESDLEDLSVDFEDLADEIANCSQSLIRFKTAPDPSLPEASSESRQIQGRPFSDSNEPFQHLPEAVDTQLFPRDHPERKGW